ncbi:MAG: hypothetical protein VX498_10630 [Myxococcota bacterium]|nr:hypothetical protein [Myxococcota bacterium]
MLTRLLVVLPFLLVAATGCGGVDPGDELPPSDGPTYYADVAPVLETWCTRCHFDGGTGPGNFEDPETVVTMGELIAGATEAELMPPPAADPSCADYEGSDRFHVSDEAKVVLRDWVDSGKALGSPDDQVSIEPWVTDLPDADLILEMAAPYTPSFDDPNNPANEYRCFILENPSEEPIYVTAMAPVLGVPELVHHIVVFLKDESQDLPGYDPETGVDCIDDVAAGAEQILAAWAPGMLPIQLPDGRGIQIGPHQDVVIQMHYFDNGEYDGTPDLSGYAFVTAEQVDVPLYMVPVGANSFSIPAGAESYTHTESLQLPTGLSGRVYTTFPHMHALGSGYELTVEHSDGSSSCISRSDAYDFDNQLTYTLLEPVRINGGDTLHQSCTWNNSSSNPDLIHDPPSPVSYGERTDEEMCFTFIFASLFEL